MMIRIATHADIEDWVKLRALLWDDTSPGQHRSEATAMLDMPPDQGIVFLAIDDDNRMRAFAEATLRHGYVNGCETSPVAFLEGIFVHPENRGTGIGRLLLQSFQSWARDLGCKELASDAYIENVESRAFHAAFGFDETDRVVFFRKQL